MSIDGLYLTRLEFTNPSRVSIQNYKQFDKHTIKTPYCKSILNFNLITQKSGGSNVKF